MGNLVKVCHYCINGVRSNQNQYYFSCQSFQKLLTFRVIFVHSLLGWTQN